MRRVESELLQRGFEINLGAYHEWRAGRPSLVCDVMEPLRVPAVDRWLVTIASRRIVNPADFGRSVNGGCRIPQDRFNDVLCTWEKHWEDHNLHVEIKEICRWIESRTRGANVNLGKETVNLEWDGAEPFSE